MDKHKSLVLLFIDDESVPLAELETPVQFELDTRKLTDGAHVLRIVSKGPSGREGIRLIPFSVRNGPAIDIEGLKPQQTVDGIVPLMINAYDKGDQKQFIITGSETPQSVPSWLWILIIAFIAWALYYLITYFNIKT